MAEFAHYNHEDSDDDALAERPTRVERTLAHAEPEHSTVPAEQEGTIFSRDKIASDLSRPLFDFIRKQEQPEAHAVEKPEPLSDAESLPSVSNPSEPETRTYQPPVEAEVAQAVHEQAARAAEEDDDDEAADDSHATHASATATPAPVASAQKPARAAENILHVEHASAPTSEPAQPAPRRQERPRPLNEQFEEIMGAEMGQDFSLMASGERLGETEDEPEPADPRTFVANWPHQKSEFAESEQPEAGGEPEPDAFYYAEAEPASESREPTPFSDAEAAEIARSARMDQAQAEARDAGMPPHAGGGGAVPPRGGTHGAASGGIPFGGGLPTVGFNAAPVAALGSPLEMFRSPGKPEKSHKGRYFAAGFITGWAVKQHLANKKMQKMNQERQKVAEAQRQEVDSLKYQQHDTSLRLQQAEGRLQETEATVTKQAARIAETQATVRQHEDRITGEAALAAPAEASSTAPAAVESGRVAEPAAEASAHQRAAEQQSTPAQESAPVHQPNRMESTPLQYAAAAAEIPFAAASAAAGAAERAPAPFAAEAQKAVPAAERPPKTPAEEAAELVEQAYKLQSGEHVEHATGGGHNIIVDSHGHEVQGAMVYGEEFKFQQRQEQVRAGAYDNSDDARKRQADNNYDTGIITGLGGSAGYPAAGDPRLGGGMPGSDKRLPLGIPKSVNPQHLLRARNQNPLVATVASPWLWASVIVLIVAFFVAAFI